MSTDRKEPDPDKAPVDLGESDEPLVPGPGLEGLPSTTLTLAASSGHVLAQRFSLTVVAGPDAGLTRVATAERMVIGTGESADLRLTDRTVSRFHCELAPLDGRLAIRDLGSRNGTLVDGISVLHAFLGPVALITIGRTQVRFELGSEHVKLALSPRTRFGTMVGASVAMRRAFALLERAAAGDATVLLEGETGTGKEAAAESIHRESARRERPFIVVDCGAIPSGLLESELFGHERGAFTGAVAGREGAFLAAQGGTIFLDEIGELGIELQPKLLRALERREVKKVGQNRYVPVDVRVVAATNRNLRSEVNARRFRSDLYYRLAVLEVRLPPLRERGEDLPALVEHILSSLGVAADSPEAELVHSPEFLAELGRHAWPGNVRELRNYVERCLALREAQPIGDEGFGEGAGEPAVDVNLPLKVARERWVAHYERRYLEEILRQQEGNVSAAARAAGVDRIHFYRLLWKHGLK
ncbi:MAG TPA: sigma 54-interacting transcriptional regulator [Polyangia bacterium]|nr:sigma 54-interacting transcriptional regulator [Polyangia bacterium]